MAYQTMLLNGGRAWMVFVDGENMAKRGADVLRAAEIPPVAGPYWRKDVFLWLPGSVPRNAFFAPSSFGGVGPSIERAERAYYYTSTTVAESEFTDRRIELRNLGFEPRLFQRKEGKSKAVDIALATDMLTLGTEGRYEVAVLISGDGDYVPVVEAVKRMGHQVVVVSFEDEGQSTEPRIAGQSIELRIAADDFVDLTPHLVSAWANHLNIPVATDEYGHSVRKATDDKLERP